MNSLNYTVIIYHWNCGNIWWTPIFILIFDYIWTLKFVYCTLFLLHYYLFSITKLPLFHNFWTFRIFTKNKTGIQDKHFTGVYKNKYFRICFDKYFTNVLTILFSSIDFETKTWNGIRKPAEIVSNPSYVNIALGARGLAMIFEESGLATICFTLFYVLRCMILSCQISGW